MTERTILVIQEYGEIHMKLGELLQQKGIARGKLSSLTGVRFEVIDKWAKGKVERMDLDVLARICYVLNCAVGDLLEYRES